MDTSSQETAASSDMKKLTITIACQPPTAADEEMLGKLLAGVSACYMALALNLESIAVPEGLARLLTDEVRKRIASEVAGCNRMVAYVTFIGLGVQAEIKFSKEKTLVKNLAICFALKSQKFEVLWGA